jgi:DNA-binding LacI/PurR family transcriptional regulator
MENVKHPPLYRQLIDALVGRIRSRDLKPHERVPSIRRIAREHQVSEITARRCIDEMVKAGTLYTRQGIGTFVADGAVDRIVEPVPVALKRAAVIGYVGGAASPVSSYDRMALGIEDAAGEFGVELQRVSVRQVNRCGGVEPYLGAHGLQGVVLFGITNPAYIRQVASVAPTVVLDYWLPDEELDYVVVDNVPGAYTLTRHLLELGHKRIAYVGGHRKEDPKAPAKTDPDSHERLTGFRMAQEEANVELDERFIFLNLCGEQETVEEILSCTPPPTALFAFSRGSALRLSDLLLKRGVRVPEDMSLVTFSADPACTSPDYPLTCMYVDGRRMGRIALQRLADRIRVDTPGGMKLAVPGAFVKGRSTARLEPMQVGDRASG